MWVAIVRATRLTALTSCLLAAGAVPAQMHAAVSAPATPDYPGYAMQMLPPVTPSRSEIASSAFEKLDAAHLGYVTREQVAKLEGFGRAFAQADRDKDGKLSPAEFDVAWAIYTASGG